MNQSIQDVDIRNLFYPYILYVGCVATAPLHWANLGRKHGQSVFV